MSITSGRPTPATTCALVTTRSGATTNPEPSWVRPQASPSILTVEGPAASTAAFTTEVSGNGTKPAIAGGSPLNTSGKPSCPRKVSTFAKTDGGWGSTLSSARTIREFCIADARLVKLDAPIRLPASQTTSRVAMTATPTPSPESTGPSLILRRAAPECMPMMLPTVPSTNANPRTSTMATTALYPWTIGCATRSTASVRPRASRPPQKPPYEKSWSAAPRLSPLTAEIATIASTTMSTQFTRQDPCISSVPGPFRWGRSIHRAGRAWEDWVPAHHCRGSPGGERAAVPHFDDQPTRTEPADGTALAPGESGAPEPRTPAGPAPAPGSSPVPLWPPPPPEWQPHQQALPHRPIPREPLLRGRKEHGPGRRRATRTAMARSPQLRRSPASSVPRLSTFRPPSRIVDKTRARDRRRLPGALVRAERVRTPVFPLVLSSTDSSAPESQVLSFLGVSALVWIGYLTFFGSSRRGQTLGMMLYGIAVRDDAAVVR